MSNRCFSGLHMAEVTDVGGDRSGLNKIKTKLISEGGEGIALDYAPVLTDSAGSGYGNVSLPKKGDFVIVAFLDNDMQQPVILGSVPTPTKKPPVKAKKKNNLRVHKTADGAEITIDEDEQKPKISIKTKNGHTAVWEDSSNNNSIKIKSKDSKTSFLIDFKKSTIEIKAKKINLKADQEVLIKAGGSSATISNASGVSIKSPKGKIVLNGNSQEFKATSTMKLQSNAQLSVQSSANLNLKSNAVTQVGGSLIKIG